MKFFYKFLFSLWEWEKIQECKKELGFLKCYFKESGYLQFSLYRNGFQNFPALICIHGFLDAGYGFRKLLREFTYPGPVYLPDLPGFGRSKLPKMSFLYQLDIFSELIGLWLEKIPEEKCILLGHSMGGLIVQKLALVQNPTLQKKIRALILLAPGGIPHPRRDEMRDILFPKTEEDIQKLLTYLYMNQIPELPRIIQKVLLTEWDSWKNHALAENTIRKEKEIFHGDKVKKIQQPTLLIGGDQDELVTPSMMQKFHQWIPHSTLYILKNAKHALHNEKCMEVSNLSKQFLTKHKKTIGIPNEVWGKIG